MSNKITRLNWRLIVGILVSVTTVAFIGIRGLTGRIELQHSTASTFRDFDRVNQRLVGNVMKARLFVLKNYDSFVLDLNTADALCASLKAHLNHLGSNEDPLVSQQTDIICQKVSVRRNLFEYFKSENSLVQNSFRFLPTLVDSLPEGETKHVAIQILNDLLRLNSFGSEELQRRLSKSLRSLKEKQKSLSADQKYKIESLKKHTEILLEATEKRTKIETQLAALDLNADLITLRKRYERMYERKSKRAGEFHFALILICAGGGVLIIFLFRKLNEANAGLASVNDDLERKVALRTSELEGALSRISDQKQMLVQSAKMSALGEMAGGVAHEINTPLTAIMLNAEMVQDEAKRLGNEHLAESSEAILKTVDRISKIVQGLKRFSRNNGSDEMTLTPVQSIIDDTLSLCVEKLRAQSYTVEVCNPNPDAEVMCVPEQISQVLLNLLNNSYDAIRDSGPTSKKWIRVEVDQVDAATTITVTDGGPGVSPENRTRLMQPFFTTKPVGKGTGLGLSISRGIMEAHAGQLTFNANSPQTSFSVVLPTGNQPRKSA